MGLQNHAPQLCWIRPDLLACVWMAGGGEGTAGMAIQLSLLPQGEGAWTPPQTISLDGERSEQNPLLFVSDQALHLVHTAQDVRHFEASDSDQSPFTMQWTAMLRHQRLPLLGIDPAKPETWGPSAWQLQADLLDQPAFCRHPPLRCQDGSWLLPIYRSLEEGGDFGFDHSRCCPRIDPAAPAAIQCGADATGRVMDLWWRQTMISGYSSSSAAGRDRIYRSVSRDHGAS